MRSAYRLNSKWVLLLCGSISAAAATVVHAADFSWQAASDSNFSAASSWNPPGGPPLPNDRAIFDAGNQAGVVLFDSDPVNTQLLIRHDVATFQLNGRTYTLTSSSPADPSVILGEAAAPFSDLTLSPGGGTLQTVNSAIGWAAGADSIATIEGATWVATQGFVVGSDGVGLVEVLVGGSVQNQFSVLGSAAAADGTVTLAENSQWTTVQQILIGGEGVGEFNVEDGALASAGSAVVANGAEAQGFVQVIDAGSQWTVAGELIVGNNGYGQLDIFDGGRVVSSGASLAVAEDASAVVTLRGDGTTWQNTGDLHVGGSALADGGAVNLFIEPGATLDMTGMTRIGPAALVSIRGGTFRTTVIDNGGSIEYIVGTLHLTASDYIVGTAGLFGANLAITSGMDMIVDQRTTVDPGAFLSVIDGSYTAGTLSQQGRIGLIVGELTVLQNGTNAAGGRIHAIDSTLNFPTATPFQNLGSFDLIDVTVNGSLENPASATVNVGGSVVFNGPVRGGASFVGSGLVIFNQAYEPGDGVGRVFLDGDVTLGTNNILRMELGGTTPGEEHDQLDVLGNVTLGGTLDVVLTSGYVPQSGDEFTLMVYGSSGGSFSEQNYPELPGGLLWNFSADGDALTLAVRSSQTPGDMNGDGDVDSSDLRQFMTHFGMQGANSSQGDFDGDGKTGLADLIMLRNRLTDGSPSPAAVPEPSGAVYFLAALMVLHVSCRTIAGSGSKPARARAVK